MKGEKQLMKMKTLIVPVVAAMLAVSCGNDPAPAKDWSSEVKEFMNKEIGLVLPYFEFDEASVEYGNDDFGGFFHAEYESDKNLADAYCEKLVAAGFTFDSESEAYYKETSVSQIKVDCYFTGEEESDPTEPTERIKRDATEGEGGDIPEPPTPPTPSEPEPEPTYNVLGVEYFYVEQPTGQWNERVQQVMTSFIGEVLPYAYFDEESLVLGQTTGMHVYMYDDNYENKLITYGTRLMNAGWEPILTEDGYIFEKEFETQVVDVYYSYFTPEEAEAEGLEPGNEIDIQIAQKAYDSFPSIPVAQCFNYISNKKEVVIPPEFAVASEDAMFVYEEEVYRSYGLAMTSTYVFGATQDEINAYADALVAGGWLVRYDDGEDYSFYLPDTHATCSISNYLSDEEEPYSCIVGFSWYKDYETELDNEYVANTIAHNLGLPLSVVKEMTADDQSIYYDITNEFKDTDIEAMYAAAKAAVPAYYELYADAHQEYPSEEDPTKIEYYSDYFLVDNWEQGMQMVRLQVADMGEGVVLVVFEVSGAVPTTEWTALTAATEFVNFWNSALGQSFTPEDVSEAIGISPAYGLSLTLTLQSGDPASVETLEYYCDLALDELVGFELSESWAEDEEEAGTFIKRGSFNNVRVFVSVSEGEFTFVAYEVSDNA